MFLYTQALTVASPGVRYSVLIPLNPTHNCVLVNYPLECAMSCQDPEWVNNDLCDLRYSMERSINTLEEFCIIISAQNASVTLSCLPNVSLVILLDSA